MIIVFFKTRFNWNLIIIFKQWCWMLLIFVILNRSLLTARHIHKLFQFSNINIALNIHRLFFDSTFVWRFVRYWPCSVKEAFGLFFFVLLCLSFGLLYFFFMWNQNFLIFLINVLVNVNFSCFVFRVRIGWDGFNFFVVSTLLNFVLLINWNLAVIHFGQFLFDMFLLNFLWTFRLDYFGYQFLFLLSY